MKKAYALVSRRLQPARSGASDTLTSTAFWLFFPWLLAADCVLALTAGN